MVKPIAALQPFIENIWYCNRYIEHTECMRTLPFGCIEMVIKLSGEYTIIRQEQRFTATYSWVSGQLTKPVTTLSSGQHECIGAVFTITGWQAFSKVPATALTDRCVSLEDIFGKQANILRCRLYEAKTVELKLELLQHFMIEKITGAACSPLIRHAMSFISQHGNEKKITVHSLCRGLNTTRKTLNGHFQKYVGIPVSVYLQQRTFNEIIRHISHLPGERLIGTGYDHHFFDQAHFIKQFRSFAGITPGEFRQLVKDNIIDRTLPNFYPLPVTFLQ